MNLKVIAKFGGDMLRKSFHIATLQPSRHYPACNGGSCDVLIYVACESANQSAS